MTAKKQEPNKYAVITAIYKGDRFSSIPLEMIPDSDNIKLIMTLSETGTETTNMIKFPTTESKFIIFSKDQLYETLFEVEIMDKPTAVIAPKTKKSSATQINS